LNHYRISRPRGLCRQPLKQHFGRIVADIQCQHDHKNAGQNVRQPAEASGNGRKSRAQQKEAGNGTGRERQRVGFARALAADSAVILADEPTSFQDLDGVHRIAAVFNDWRNKGRTVIISGHDPRLVDLASAALCAALAVWLPLAAIALTESFAAYYYEVLQHRCPWCLFLPEHGRVGYLLFAALLAAALEGSVALLSAKVGICHPQLSSEAHRRCRTAAVRVSVANVVFFCLAVFPAILWRLRYGVWMG
jgi:hypothetical protein